MIRARTKGSGCLHKAPRGSDEGLVPARSTRGNVGIWHSWYESRRKGAAKCAPLQQAMGRRLTEASAVGKASSRVHRWPFPSQKKKKVPFERPAPMGAPCHRELRGAVRPAGARPLPAGAGGAPPARGLRGEIRALPPLALARAWPVAEEECLARRPTGPRSVQPSAQARRRATPGPRRCRCSKFTRRFLTIIPNPRPSPQ